MIVSASRRTDIPAFYSKWFANRVREGWCLVPNPFNKAQVSRVSLLPEDVDAFVFWTRNPRPLMPFLTQLDKRGLRYYFLFTLVGYPGIIDPGSPPLDFSVANFRHLAARIGPDRVIWRYDPILLSPRTGHEFHQENFRRIAVALRGATNRCIISFAKVYRKARKRLDAAIQGGPGHTDPNHPKTGELLRSLSRSARENGLQLNSCAAEEDLSPFGIYPGRCIDSRLISELFNTPVDPAKDPSQRPQCGCAPSKDIGAYDTCLFGCAYCYATSSLERAKLNHAAHDPSSPSLIPFLKSEA